MNVVEKSNDCDLIKNIKKGDLKSENILYQKYSEVVKKYLYSKVNECNIDDYTSDIMMRIFLKIDKYDSNKSTFNTWVTNIAKNYVIDKYRKSEKLKIDLSIDNCGNVESESENLDYFDYLNLLDKKIDKNDMSMLKLKYIDGYSYKEIGDLYNLSSSTISNKVNYIKQKIRGIFPLFDVD